MGLSIKNVSKTYGDKVIIKNISLRVEKGEIVSLLGINGSGKTTLFDIIAGVKSPTSGQIFFNGENITSTPGHVSYMPQSDLLLPYKNIIDNVSLPLVINGSSRASAREQVKKFFTDFKLEGCENKYPHEVSGGMKQRAALFRTYMCRKEFMLLDEPFSALDSINKMEMYKWFRHICRRFELSTFFITHDVDEALYLSDKIFVIRSSPGEIIGFVELSKIDKNKFFLSDDFIYHKKHILKLLRA